MSLAEIFRCHGTDKDAYNGHSYASTYEKLFGEIRDRVRTVLEVGVLDGASLKAWRDYFPNAIVVGLDHDPKSDFGDRIVVVRADSTDPAQITAAFRWPVINGEPDQFVMKEQQFDIIIDDGCHWLEEQLMTWSNLFPLLKSGGIYVTEDIQDIGNRKRFEDLGAEIIDLRGVKNRGDDVLAVWRK